MLGDRRPSHQRQSPGIFHLLDGLLTQTSLASRSSGVSRRRNLQRLALTQRLLDPLPKELDPSRRLDVLFWQGMRWGTAGFLLAWWLHH